MMEVNSRGGEYKLIIFIPYVAIDHILVYTAVVGTDVTITTRWLSDGNDICFCISFCRFVYITGERILLELKSRTVCCGYFWL